MNATTIVFIVLSAVAGVMLLVIALAVVSRVTLKAMKGPLMERVNARYDESSVLRSDYTANNFGLESKGAAQPRGNGALVLAKKELTFFQFVPKDEVTIPLRSIVETSLVKSHLGKATPYNLVKIEFKQSGTKDSIAIFVPNAAEWKQAIDEHRKA